nr:hypothetical protein [Allomuricauda sp.]
MVVLKKIKASTLMETMVATVLIVIIFMIASLGMNSLMAARVKSNLTEIKEHVQQLEYAYIHKKVELPYYEEWEGWEIALISKGTTVQVEANHLESDRQFETTIAAYE